MNWEDILKRSRGEKKLPFSAQKKIVEIMSDGEWRTAKDISSILGDDLRVAPFLKYKISSRGIEFFDNRRKGPFNEYQLRLEFR